jgi:spermidine synthase
VLSRFLIRTSGERGVKIASLYGINTAGAMIGTLLVYAVGLPMLGLFRTVLCAGILNVGIGMLCLVFDRHLEQLGFRVASAGGDGHAAGVSDATPAELRVLWLAFGLSGFSAMVYEVAWTRILSLVMGSSIYAFCIMLATFLGGIAIGSALARVDLSRYAASPRRFISLEILLGVFGLLSIPLFGQLPEWFVTFWPLVGRTWGGLLGLQCLLSAMVMVAPTLLMGYLFPLLGDIVTRRFAHFGQRLGTAYAVNTFGGILGSFLSGFLLIPVLGLPGAIICAALVNLLAGLVVFIRFGLLGSFNRRLALSAAAVVVATVLSKMGIVPLWQPRVFAEGVYLSPASYQETSVDQASRRSDLLFYRDSLNTTVSVHRQGTALFLKVGGKTDASNGIDMATQVLSAHIPLLLHPDPHRVLVIGLGSGVTLGSAGRHAVEELTCAEIDPAVVEGARFFKEYNYGIHDDPRAKIVVADGRNFLLASSQQYDVIISEPSNPWMAGLAYLFTQEFYQLAKQRLAPRGLMCQWLQLYRIFPSDVKLMLKTFHEEFPYVTVWSSIPGDVLLVGSMEPQSLSYAQLAKRMEPAGIKESLARVQMDQPAQLLQLLVLGGEQVEQVTADVQWIHQDDQPLIEFNAPKALYLDVATHELNYDGLERFRPETVEMVPDYDPSLEDAAFHRTMGNIWAARGEREKALTALEQAAALAPDAETLIQLARIHLAKQEQLKAQQLLEESLRLDPTLATPYQLLARISLGNGQVEAAAASYRQAARRKIPDSPLAEEIGNCLHRGREWSESAEYYRSAISQGGGERQELIAAYAEVLSELKDDAMTEQALEFGISRFPNDPRFPFRLGTWLSSHGRAQEAQPLFEQALLLQPTLADAHVALGRLAAQAGDTTRAVRHLKDGLRYDPYHHEALELLYQLQKPVDTGQRTVKISGP